MDESAARPGFFAKGGVGRFVLGLFFGATFLFGGACGLFTVVSFVVSMIGGVGYIATNWDELRAADHDGAAFAAGHTITECVAEAQRRSSECSSLAPMCSMPIVSFVRACVAAATDDGYCATVPAMSDFRASTQWRVTACPASLPGGDCQSVMGSVQSACDERTKKETTGDVETDEEAAAE